MTFDGKNKKRIILILIIVAVVAILVANVIKITVGYNNAINSQIPDTNGDSKVLCSIDSAYIESVTSEFDILKHNWSKDSSAKSGVAGKYAEKDVVYSRETAESLSGVYVCNAYKATGKTVQYTVDSVVNSGNLRIVFTDSQNKILHDIPIDQTYNFEFDTVNGEVYYLKLVGESANITVRVMRSEY